MTRGFWATGTITGPQGLMATVTHVTKCSKTVFVCPEVKLCSPSCPQRLWVAPAKVPQYLLIILQLIVQDDSIGLVRLGPGQGDAVHGAAHLVHDGHSRGGCKRNRDSGTVRHLHR